MNFLKPFPFLCNYYITTRCNARCVFCDIHLQNGKNADTEDILRNLCDLKKIGIRFIDLTGGEPLLHPDLPFILKESRQLGLITTVTTNCILYPMFAEKIRGLVNLLHFSLDAPVKKDHDNLRGVPCFDKVMESLEISVELNEKPDILFTVNNDNAHYLQAMVDLAQKMKRILIVNPVFSYFGNNPPGIHVLEEIKQYASEPFVYVNRAMIAFMKSGGNRIDSPQCRAVTTTVVISSDNELVFPCYHKANHRLPINGSFFDLWNKHYQKKRKQEGRYKFCSECTISCYFDPSFIYGLDKYFYLSILPKFKYILEKKCNYGINNS
jgi:MoaA/NifB/PqqE/SkfB family radical SAM enzyme